MAFCERKEGRNQYRLLLTQNKVTFDLPFLADMGWGQSRFDSHLCIVCVGGGLVDGWIESKLKSRIH